jgi:RNA-directed DNA polymerase
MQADEAEAPARAARGERSARNAGWAHTGAKAGTATGGQTKSEECALLERVVERSNMQLAYRRVVANKGAAGVDGVVVTELADWLKENWPSVKKALLEGRYLPQAVRRVDIPKPQGGVRTLGVPTVVDRLIQQALHQVLSPVFETGFHERSYGFRPGRSAQQAVQQAQQYVREGRRWVVDLDIEKFFDRVNHDVLMARVARRVGDERVLKLIRRYLQAGMMADGLTQPRTEGTPQGGPLSPLLSNILLTGLDRELERRGLAFVRYADDCNVYVRSRRAGERVMGAIQAYLGGVLKLTVNAAKSAVARPWERKFLGYSVTAKDSRLRIAPQSLKRLRERIKDLLRQGRGRSLARTIETLNPLLRGWINYFRLSQTRTPLEDLDVWVRRHLRRLLWKQWKRPTTRERRLRQLGLAPERAWRSSVNGRGPWWNAGARHMVHALPPSYFARMGLVSLVATHQALPRVA